MRKIMPLLIWISFVVLVIISCSKKNNQSIDISTLSDEQIISDVQPILQNYLNGQYSILTNKSKSLDWQRLQENPADESIAQKISFLKSEELKIDFQYTDYTSKLTIDSFEKKEKAIHLKITDYFTKKTNALDSKSGEFIVTEGSQEYDVMMKYKDTTWIISNFFPIGEDPWYINLEPTVGNINEESNGTEPNGGTQENSINENYQPELAVRYAYDHWSNPNKYYCDYGEGGDCTNFLSQCLLRGGWTVDEKWYAIGAGCCDNKFPSCVSQNCFTCTWTVAHSFYKYVSKSDRIYPACYIDNVLSIGDILQFDWESDGEIDHSSIVTKKEGSGNRIKVFVTYRSRPKIDRLSVELPGVHYGWKTKSSNHGSGPCCGMPAGLAP